MAYVNHMTADGIRKEIRDKEAVSFVQEQTLTDEQKTRARANIGAASKADTVLDTTLSRGRKANSSVGTGSFAFGYDVEASGNYSHAEGSGTVASGPVSHAEGVTTRASGDTSHAEGVTTNASGNYSHAEGNTTIASGNCSHAEGIQTTASGDYSHTEGAGTTASGNFSHSEGNSTIASGANSHAEGSGATSSGSASHAEGESTVASGNDSHAEGAGTTASGKYSHAEGTGTTASGNSSHAEGNYTTASGAFQHVFGEYNTNDPEASPSNPNTKGKYIEIVGNGKTDQNRSNGRTLDWSGNEELAGDLTIFKGTANETSVSELKSQFDDWMDANGFAGGSAGKVNLLDVPYSSEDVLNGKQILSTGSIGDAATKSVSPLIPITAGTYGLKTSHDEYIGMIADGNSYKNGYGFFAADGTTVVARPTTLLHNVGTDIYVFDAPADAAYVRFCYVSSGTDYYNTALGYFNQWILLPDADDNIDDSFFILDVPTTDGETDKILRTDNSKVYLRDNRVGSLSNLTTTDKSSVVAAVNEIAGSSGGDTAADAWLVKNDLDPAPSEKVNLLDVPYSSADVLNGKQILSSGSIGDTSNKSVSPLIPITAGTYGLKTSHDPYVGMIATGNAYKNGYGFFAVDGTTVVARPSTLLHSVGTDIYVFDAPSDAAYVRFCYVSSSTNYDTALGYFNQWILLPDADDNIDDSFFVIPKKPDGEISEIYRADGSRLEIVDETARGDIETLNARPITFGRRTCAIFKKVCCIGDSFTAGYIMNTSGQATDDPGNSWPAHMAIMTGREYVNCGISGATSKSWLTNVNGLAKMQIPANQSQAYLIGLQINDANVGMTVGTVADIGSDADSYVRWISDIIDAVFAVNSLAHVFIQTQPKNYTGAHTPYRAALLEIVDWYQNNGTHRSQVHLIDLLDYYKLYQNPGCNDSMANGHFTAPGWEYCAEILMYAWSNYINAHPLVFQDVNLIPYGTAT